MGLRETDDAAKKRKYCVRRYSAVDERCIFYLLVDQTTHIVNVQHTDDGKNRELHESVSFDRVRPLCYRGKNSLG